MGLVPETGAKSADAPGMGALSLGAPARQRAAGRAPGLVTGRSGAGVLVVLAAAALGVALTAAAPISLFAGAVAGTLLCLCGLVLLSRGITHWRDSAVRDALAEQLAQDPSPTLVTDDRARILARNPAAVQQLPSAGDHLSGALASALANPEAAIKRLLEQAASTGAGQEHLSTRNGAVRISVQRRAGGGLIWRVDLLADRAGGRSAERFPVPILTVGRGGSILFMNEAARQLAGGRLKTLDEVFVTGPVRPGQINRICDGGEGPRDVMVIEQAGSAGRREMILLPAAAVPQAPVGQVEGLPVPVMTLDGAGHIRSLNHQARDLLGGQAAPGDSLSAFMAGLGRSLEDWMQDIASGRTVNQTEFLRLTRQDRDMFVQVTLSRMQGADGPAILAVLHDATELKTLEAQFVQTQKMQAIGQLAGGVAHDFNNLLTAISGHCDLLLLRHDRGDPDYADLIQIRQNANRAAALVGQLLAFSRKQTLRPETLDLRDTLADLTHLLNRLVGEKVTLTLIHDPLLGTIRADKRQLEQVLMNLVVNARDAMPSGGEIRIETQAVTLTEALRRDRARVPPGDYVIVRVTDQGVGIEPEKQQKIFEPFYTTKRTGEGTGLGLSTAYGIVKQTGGFIFVDSQPGAGTCFTLYLPVVTQEPAGDPVTAADPPEPAPRPGEGVVLLVEDEAPVRAFASRALRLRGYTVLEAESAEDALTLLEDSSVSVDVFVTDVVMPGMDGPTWVRKALRDRPGVRVVFVSGYAEGAFDNKGGEVPNSTFLPKPFSLSQLTETVNRQMH